MNKEHVASKLSCLIFCKSRSTPWFNGILLIESCLESQFGFDCLVANMLAGYYHKERSAASQYACLW